MKTEIRKFGDTIPSNSIVIIGILRRKVLKGVEYKHYGLVRKVIGTKQWAFVMQRAGLLTLLPDSRCRRTWLVEFDKEVTRDQLIQATKDYLDLNILKRLHIWFQGYNYCSVA